MRIWRKEDLTEDDHKLVRRLRTKKGQLDLRKVKQPHRAARALWAYLITYHDAPAFMVDPEYSEELGTGRNWRVVWEGGPYEWAAYLSGGGSLYGSYQHEPEVLLLENKQWYVAPYYSFCLCFLAA